MDCSGAEKRLSHVLSVSQVFMLDTQCSPKTPNNKDGFEHAQSCVLIIELPADQQANGHAQKRWTLVSLTDACFNSLTPNQMSLLVLTDILSSCHIASGFLLNPNQCLLLRSLFVSWTLSSLFAAVLQENWVRQFSDITVRFIRDRCSHAAVTCSVFIITRHHSPSEEEQTVTD